MAELLKQWNDGGSLSVTYDGDRDGSAVFSSEQNEGIDREMSVAFVDASRQVNVARTVKQIGMREIFEEGFTLADGGTFNVLKPQDVKPYTEIEYIESTGTQYIDTRFNIDTSTDEIELVIQCITTTVYKWFFGEHDNNARFGLGSGDGIDKRNVAYGNNTYKVSDSQIYNSKHTFIANKEGVFLDEVKIVNYSSFASTSTLYLFHLNLNNQSSYMGGARIWSYKHTRNGKAIRDFIPVLDKDGVACMYDVISGTFFYNKGTGDFIAGNIIE